MKRLVGVLLVVVLMSSCGIGEPKMDYPGFLSLLSDNGIQYTEAPAEDSFLSVPRRPVTIGDETIGVYEYKNNKLMEFDAGYIDPKAECVTLPEKTSCLTWISYPYFFKQGRIIVNYDGENQVLIDLFTQTFGESFAGFGPDDADQGLVIGD